MYACLCYAWLIQKRARVIKLIYIGIYTKWSVYNLSEVITVKYGPCLQLMQTHKSLQYETENIFEISDAIKFTEKLCEIKVQFKFA